MKKLIKYLLPVIMLIMGTQVQAQWYNDGAVTNPGGLVSDWTGQGINTATGSYSTVGSTGAPDKYGVFEHRGQTGTGANSALVNNGPYDASVNGRDYFLGPSGAAGQQGIGGTSAPTFGELFLQNGVGQLFDITNSNGANVATIANFGNGITTTVRSNSSTGALRFLDGALYSNTVVGDAQYVNGYVSKVGNDVFLFPVGDQNGSDLRTLTISAPATATDHISIAYWKGDPGTGLDPTGGAHSTASLNTTPLNGETLLSVSPIGFWDWVPVSGTDNIDIRVSMPQNAGVPGGYSDAANMRLVGWNTAAGQWELLGNTGATGTGEGAALTGSTGAQPGRTMASYSAIGWGSIAGADLTPTLDIDDLNFAAAGDNRDFVVNIFNIGTSVTDGSAIVFRIAKLPSFTITYPTVSGSSNVFGGTPNTNGDWTFTENASFITVTGKPVVSIAGNGGASIIGFHIQRNAGVPVNTSQSITPTIAPGSGGEVNVDNNAVSTTVTAN